METPRLLVSRRRVEVVGLQVGEQQMIDLCLVVGGGGGGSAGDCVYHGLSNNTVCRAT